MFFTENWKYIFNDTEGRNTFRIVHEDGTVVLIDRTEGTEKIRIFDGVNKHEILLDPDQIRVTHGKTGAVITFDKDGNITVVSPEKVVINTEKETVVNAEQNVEVNTGADAKVTAKGEVEVNAGGAVNVNGKSVKLIGGKGVITGDSLDPYTGFPHIDASLKVRASK